MQHDLAAPTPLIRCSHEKWPSLGLILLMLPLALSSPELKALSWTSLCNAGQESRCLHHAPK